MYKHPNSTNTNTKCHHNPLSPLFSNRRRNNPPDFLLRPIINKATLTLALFLKYQQLASNLELCCHRQQTTQSLPPTTHTHSAHASFFHLPFSLNTTRGQ
ncbi:hypothetical protein DCAR_0830923 [Daucus carota subsp. sativus]|uniref:Uncharacterized protein n=1 Tax=Daucus carota subsp. sativus TaxID=79200 RepID=A0A175YD31_DAUCS|nr:hypothetical protein DCAR_0830923 [Daucus carota subsp. sativus]